MQPCPFSLVVLSCLATVSGAFETISACLVDENPRLRQYKPAIAFTALVVAFLVNLALTTQVDTMNKLALGWVIPGHNPV